MGNQSSQTACDTGSSTYSKFNDSVGITLDIPPDKLREAQDKLQQFKAPQYILPDRGNLDDPSIEWRQGKPNYTLANLMYFQGKTQAHPEGSLELVVENLVKTWEMEGSHKPKLEQWTTIDPQKYHVQANGGKIFDGKESSSVGNYNWLMSSCQKELYDASAHDFESSHRTFHTAMPQGFAWEVLQVFSPPPKVAFSWRHWGIFDGHYKNNTGKGQLLQMFGFAVVLLDQHLKITNIQIYYKPEEFLQVLEGIRPCTPSEGCPFTVVSDCLGNIITQSGFITQPERWPRSGFPSRSEDENVSTPSSTQAVRIYQALGNQIEDNIQEAQDGGQCNDL